MEFPMASLYFPLAFSEYASLFIYLFDENGSAAEDG